MSHLLNVLFLVATLLWLVVVLYQTLTGTLTPTMRKDWPLRQFWVSERFRRVCLLLTFGSALAWVLAVLGGGLELTRPGWLPWLYAAAIALALSGLAAMVYSVLLYRGPSAAKPDRF